MKNSLLFTFDMMSHMLSFGLVIAYAFFRKGVSLPIYGKTTAYVNMLWFHRSKPVLM